MSFLRDLAEGGCLWRKQPNSPGYTISVPNGTPFRIATEGPYSHIYVAGVCQDGMFAVVEGREEGRSFPSASAAVSAVREPNSNAFLHMHFLLDGRYVSAETLRERPSADLAVEERAFEMARDVIKTELGRRNEQISESQLAQKAAAAALRSEPLRAEAQRQIAELRNISLSDLGL